MNWDVIGVIVETVGATAVVITLIYLSRQIRFASEESQVHGTYASVELYANWRSHLINNPDLSDLISKANRNEQLVEAETARLAAFFDDLAMASFVSYTASVKSNPLYKKGAEVEFLVAYMETNPGLVPHWKRVSGLFEMMNNEFPKLVESRLTSGPNVDAITIQ